MTDATETPDDIERELKDRLRWLCSIFGQPSELLRVLTVAEWRRLRTWVRGLEALAARLIRALAATMQASPSPTSWPTRPTRILPVAPDTEYPDSARWLGVRFLFRDEQTEAARPPATAGACAAGLAQAAPPNCWEASRGFRSARGLALRLEAVIRVVEQARRYAQRLARRKARPARRAPGHAPPPMKPSGANITAPGPPQRPPLIETG